MPLFAATRQLAAAIDRLSAARREARHVGGVPAALDDAILGVLLAESIRRESVVYRFSKKSTFKKTNK